jgi:CIC family chloride channel protein
MTKDIIVCYPDENLRTALQKLGTKEIGRAPVVNRNNPSRLIGLITRENIIDAYNEVLKKREEAGL